MFYAVLAIGIQATFSCTATGHMV